MTTLKDFADIATSIGVILGVFLALYGIDAWRREAMWKRRSELCEEVLALCYEVKEIISYMRSSGGFGGEGETRQPDEGEPDDVRHKKNLAWIPIERHNKHLEKLSRLWALSYRFRAQFSIEATKPIEDLRDIVNSVKSAAHVLSVFWTTFNWEVMTPEQYQKNRVLQDHYEAILWEGLKTGDQVNGVAPPDEIQTKVDDAVKRIERTCREVLHAQHTLFGILNIKLKSIRGDICS